MCCLAYFMHLTSKTWARFFKYIIIFFPAICEENSINLIFCTYSKMWQGKQNLAHYFTVTSETELLVRTTIISFQMQRTGNCRK